LRRLVEAFAIGALLLCWCLGAQARVQELKTARAFLQVASKNAEATPQEEIRTTAQLPFHWDRNFPATTGRASFDIPFTLERLPAYPYALYIPRVGNAFAIWINDVLVQSDGDLDEGNGDDFAKLPVFVTIPPNQLRNDNVIHIRIRVDRGRRGGLSSVVIGPHHEVYPIYLKDHRLRAYGSQAVATLSLLVGLIAMALWATQADFHRHHHPATFGLPHGQDPLYLMAGLAELCWAVSVSDFLTESPFLPWPWWGVLMVTATTCWASFMALFCAEVAHWRQYKSFVWFQLWLVGLVLGCVAALIVALGFGYPQVLTAWYVVFGVTFVIFIGVFVKDAFKGASTAHRLVAVSAAVNVAVGVYDLYVLRFSTDYRDNTYLRYSSVLFGITLLYIVIMQFRSVSEHARDLMDTLASRIAQRESELEDTYQRLEESNHAQAKSMERTRVLRDLHDGVGSHLSVALRQLQTEKYSREDVLHTVSDALDHLKLSIDAMSLPAGDITAVLANLRYRLDPRLKESGITLHWHVGKLPIVEYLNEKAMHQLQFIVYGALSNVLQHAHATEMHIQAGHSEHSIGLRVMDNGIGFDPGPQMRKGLQSMQDRARVIGASLSIHSQPGMTIVEVEIPLAKGDWVMSSQY
jgi:signal transduction histidine kinase